MLNSYLNYLQESSIPTKWRKRVEVYILKGDKIVVGYKKDKKIYMPAGGGVERGQSLEEAARIESLEELGIKIKNPVLITNKTYKVDWHAMFAAGVELDVKIKGRMKYFRGQEIHFMKAEYDGINKKYYGRDNDAMKPFILTKQKLIQELRKNSWAVNRNREKIVRML